MSSRGLLRPTPMSGKAIFKFSIFINYMYYVFFTIHIIYTKNTGGLWCCLGRVTFREGFQVSPKGFKTVLSPCTILVLDFYMIILYMCFTHILIYFLTL